MATIKSFTDISQSKKLAEILPLESADMHYVLIDTDEDKYAAGLGKYIGILPHYPCWSLAVLLDALPNEPDIVKGQSDDKDGRYMCTVGYKNDILSTFSDNPVDACVDMIIKLNELKML